MAEAQSDCSTTTARSSAPTTGRGAPSPVTGGSSTRRAEGAADRLALPDANGVGGHLAVHRPRHARLRAVGEPVPAARRRRRSARRTSWTRSAAARTRTSAPASWLFDTATGGPSDLVTAPAQEGLHALVTAPGRLAGRRLPHAVRGHGRRRDGEPDVRGGDDRGRHRLVRRHVHVEPSISTGLDGRGVRAQPARRPRHRPSSRTTPNDPSSASVKRDVTIDHASRLTVVDGARTRTSTCSSSSTRTETATFTNDEIVAASATGTGERVRRAHPARGRRLPGLGPGLGDHRHADSDPRRSTRSRGTT